MTPPSPVLDWTPRPLGGLWRWLRTMFIVYLMTSIIADSAYWLSWSVYSASANPTADMGVVVISMAAWALAGIAQLLLWSIDFLFLRLFFRALKNARALEPQLVTRSPAWTMVWNFIPFVNVWRPFGAMLEVWRVSASGEDKTRLPWTMIAWWTAWVMFWILAWPLYVLDFVLPQQTGPPRIDVVTLWLPLGAAILLFASIVFAIFFLERLVRLHDQKIQATAFE